MTWLKKIFLALTRNERIAFFLAALGAVISLMVVGGFYLARATMAVPAAGGEYVEGTVGQPEYVNPVIASSKTDLGLVKLVYSNLSDIAASVTASPDMRTWNVRLKENLTWQDGQKLTSDDVIFTVQKIQDPTANSPLYASWQGVAATRVSELEVQFNLANPYAFFTDNISGLYILPKHLFDETPPANWRLSDYNLKPVGSGPYKFISYSKGADGFISSYNLATWKGYQGTEPLIQNFNFQFFNDENALVQSFNSGAIDGFGNASPEDKSEIERPYDTFSWRTSGYYAIFWNQSKNLALQDASVREALSAAIDRNALVASALGGNGVPEYGPVPPEAKYVVDVAQTSSQAYAGSLLDAAGWTVGSDGMRSKTIQKSVVPLVINLTVPQIDFLAKTAAFVQSAWQAIGVQVNVLPASADDIVGTTVKNRDYEALLFGNVLGPSSDLYSFWDSSQRFSPGLNLAIYSNTKVDNDIESARQNTDDASRAQQFADAETRIATDNPAVFLYSPDYIYVSNKNVQGIATNLLADPSDRFREIGTWYLNTARVLK